MSNCQNIAKTQINSGNEPKMLLFSGSACQGQSFEVAPGNYSNILFLTNGLPVSSAWVPKHMSADFYKGLDYSDAKITISGAVVDTISKFNFLPASLSLKKVSSWQNYKLDCCAMRNDTDLESCGKYWGTVSSSKGGACDTLMTDYCETDRSSNPHEQWDPVCTCINMHYNPQTYATDDPNVNKLVDYYAKYPQCEPTCQLHGYLPSKLAQINATCPNINVCNQSIDLKAGMDINAQNVKQVCSIDGETKVSGVNVNSDNDSTNDNSEQKMYIILLIVILSLIASITVAYSMRQESPQMLHPYYGL
jgi:hypothetical protein